MKLSKYQKQLNDIRKEVLDDIFKIFEKYHENEVLNLVDEDGQGIDLDCIRCREATWEQYNDGINEMDKNGELYTDWDLEININEFSTCELVRFYEKITELYQ